MLIVRSGLQGRNGVLALALVLAIGLVACGGGEPEAEPMAEESMVEESTAAAPAAPMADRSSTTSSVSFVRPADGSTVSSPVSMEFIVSNLNISPVPDEVETAREGMGHYHVAIDTECLAVGELIPKADPWVHFGDGSKIYETLMTAGQHTLTVQIGDDDHRTQEGLCTTISITVE